MTPPRPHAPPGPRSPRSLAARPSRRTALLALLIALSSFGCPVRREPAPPPDPSPVLGLWSGREGLSFGRYREWRLDLRAENILRPGGRATPGTGQYTEAGVVCEVRFLANFYPGTVPRVNLSIAGNSANCSLQRFTLYAALPIADTMVGQLSEGSSDQYANVTFQRTSRTPTSP